MPSVAQVRVEQQGDVGGLGWSVFHATNAGSGVFSAGDANSFGAALQSLYFALKALFPTDLTFTVEPIVKMLDIATGHLVAEVPMGSVPVPVVGTATETYAAGTGIRGYWHTGTIRGTRLMRGATFFTPITANDYTTGGLISTVSTSGTQAAMASYIADMTSLSLSACVWGRPHPKGASNGVVGPITTATVSQTVSSLRSRRT